jgi:thiol-disulfide isomerase/thioredoxin
MSRSAAALLVLIALLGGMLVTTSGCRPALESQPGAEPEHPLVGKSAPLFNTSFLDGAPFDLGQHLGKDVVVLDFWATWCGPCVASMPTLSEVSSEFRDRGVRLFAVNCAEQPEEVKDFVEQSGLELTVVMDPDGSVMRAYGADGIPQTVQIDRQGKVRFVHVGSQNLREWLTEKLGILSSEAPGSPSADETAATR